MDDSSDQPRFKAVIGRGVLLESIIDFMIDQNPLELDDDNLIKNMNEIVEFNGQVNYESMESEEE